MTRAGRAPVSAEAEPEDLPDVRFSLGGGELPENPAERTEELTRRVVAELEAGAPQGWTRLQAAFVQFDIAASAAVLLTPLPADEAVVMVRDHTLERGLETPGYPVSGLVAERISVGWIVPKEQMCRTNI